MNASLVRCIAVEHFLAVGEDALTIGSGTKTDAWMTVPTIQTSPTNNNSTFLVSQNAVHETEQK